VPRACFRPVGLTSVYGKAARAQPAFARALGERRARGGDGAKPSFPALVAGRRTVRGRCVMKTYKVGYLIGSLATQSINRKLAQALIRLAPEGLEFSEISFRDLPLYSYDYDDDYPEVARSFKAAIKASDAILFVTPEYNRSIPGGLKNAIDWASRPYGTNAFANKPSAVIGASPGAIGTAVAEQRLRS